MFWLLATTAYMTLALGICIAFGSFCRVGGS